MKKLLGVSIAAMLAVTPMIASADGKTPTAATNVAATNNPFVGVAVDNEAHIATTSYVQGAYNAAIGAINEVATTAGAAQTAAQVTTAINNAAGAGLSTNNSGVLSVAGGDGITVDTTNDVVKVNNGNGLEIGTDTDAGKLKVKAGDTTITVDSNGVKVGTITDSNITDGTISQSKINGLGTALNGKQAQLKTNGTGTPNIQTTVYTTMNTDISGTGENQARDDVLVTEKAVATALANVASDAVIIGGAGINNTDNTISVDLVTTNPTLQITNNKLEAKVGDGLQAGSTGIEVKLSSNKGLQLDNTNKSLEVLPGDGIAVGSGGVAVDLTDDTGLIINSTTKKLEIKNGDGIKAGSNGIEVDLKSDGGLSIDNGQIKLTNGVQAANAPSTYTGTGLTTKGYVDEAIATGLNGKATETGVTATISNSTVPVFTAWGADTTTNVYVKSAAYTTTARESGVAAN